MIRTITACLFGRKRQKGAALILTVVVIMVLTTLGLAMVGFSTTEERTATSYRDGLQARATAEAGIRLAQEMFRDPANHLLVPVYSSVTTDCNSGGTADYCGATESTTETSLNALGIWRADRSPKSPARYTGGGIGKFFVGPFGTSWGQTFGGTYNSTASSDIYDLKFNCTNPSTGVAIANRNTACWLDVRFNALLQTSSDYNLTTGTVTDISFYGPPAVNGRAYGICTVRVTAVKTDAQGSILAREVMEAVIGDSSPRPAVLSNGNMMWKTHAGTSCGDGCENIHANGDVTIGSISDGVDPMITATGTISGGNNTQAGARAITAPKINPWDLAYKPTVTADLNKYYLLAARALDTIWTDGNPSNNNAPRPCGINSLSLCQDYNLEYDAAGTAKTAKTATDVPAMYKWDAVGAGWTLCSTGNSLSGGVACPGAPTFSVTPAADVIVVGSDDNADIPFNVNRVARTDFHIGTPQAGASVLVDGMFTKSSALSAMMSVVAVGSMTFSASTTWGPGASNYVMWISGRDIQTGANCCAPSNTCATNVSAHPDYAGIIATHEQFGTGAQNALLGVLVAENRVDHDSTVTGGYAINSDNGDHGSLCDHPDWPWALPTVPSLFSLKSVPD